MITGLAHVKKKHSFKNSSSNQWTFPEERRKLLHLCSKEKQEKNVTDSQKIGRGKK